jgi:hypothetical protein
MGIPIDLHHQIDDAGISITESPDICIRITLMQVEEGMEMCWILPPTCAGSEGIVLIETPWH